MRKTVIAFTAAGLMLFGMSTGVAVASPNQPGPVSQLVKTHVLTLDQVQAFKVAMTDQRELNQSTRVSQVCDGLVADGTFTAEQAAAVAAAPGPRAMRELVKSGVLTREQAMKFRQAMQADAVRDREALLDAVLADLVADGTLTQEQADALKAAVDLRGPSGPPVGKTPGVGGAVDGMPMGPSDGPKAPGAHQGNPSGRGPQGPSQGPGGVPQPTPYQSPAA